MMDPVRVQWGRHGNVIVDDEGDLADLLAGIAAERGAGDCRFKVAITRGVDEWLAVGLGEQRAIMFWTGGGWGGQPDTEPIAEDLWFDAGGVPTDYEPVQTRVLPDVAMAAALDYARTGRLPAGVTFGPEYDPYGQPTPPGTTRPADGDDR